MSFTPYTGVARELKELRDRWMRSDISYLFKMHDIAILEQATHSIEKLFELYIKEKDKPPYNATAYYAGFTAGWNEQRTGGSMASVATHFEQFKQGMEMADPLYKPEATKLPQYTNARAYADSQGIDVPDDLWETLAEVLQQWPEMREFDYISKIHGKFRLRFDEDGKVEAFRFNDVFRGNVGVLPPEHIDFFDIDTGESLNVPVEKVNFEDGSVKISHTEYHQLSDKLHKRNKRIAELEAAIAEHRDNIKSQKLGDVTANKELWRHVHHID